MSSIVSFRVSRRLKARMDRLRHINWSELLRRYVETVVEQEEKRVRVSRDPAVMRRAVEEMDRLPRISESLDWLGEEEVIKWRRLSYLTQA
ncbi:MAG: hypothetical protein NXY59_08005 [Aigarchaeota archaeon]|nr:hypothetical protein [Candidatus Pelearchaeum maunauluense]